MQNGWQACNFKSLNHLRKRDMTEKNTHICKQRPKLTATAEHV